MNFATQSSWCELQLAFNLVFADYIECPSSAAKNIINLFSVLTGDILVCSRLLSCWKRGIFAMTSAFPWQNSVSLCPASFCTPRWKLPVTPCISWPTFASQSPMMKRTFFCVLLVLEGLVGLQRTVQLQLLWHYWLRYTLGLLWCWMVCLGSEPRSSVVLEIAPKYSISDSFANMKATPFLLRDSCP